MDPTTSLITTTATVCIAGFRMVAVVAAFYGIVIRFPRYQQQKVDNLKANGNSGVIGGRQNRRGVGGPECAARCEQDRNPRKCMSYEAV